MLRLFILGIVSAFYQCINPVVNEISTKYDFYPYRLLGSIPGPILYGRLIDEACVLSSGKCLFYNNYNMSVYLTIVTCVAKSGAVICFIVAQYTSRRCKIPEDQHIVVEVPSRTQEAQELLGTGKLTT